MIKRHTVNRHILWLLVLAFVVGCSSPTNIEPTREPPKVTQVINGTATYTLTPAPTATLTPIAETPTKTAISTATPTRTPQPTATKIKVLATLAKIAPTNTKAAPTSTKPPTVAPTSPPASPPTATNTPVPQVGIALLGLTSPVSKGANASITIQTSPGANCSITVIYKSGPSSAAGLYPKTAGGDGVVSWTWKVGTRTTSGTWPIKIDCTPGGHADYSFTVQ